MMQYSFALYAREVKRFQKILLDTLLSPIVSLLLYLSVFGVILGKSVVMGIPYVAYVYIGLLTMSFVNASFSNPAFALVIGKNLGTNVDLQVVPVRPFGIALAYAFAAATRGLLTLCAAIALTVWFVPSITILHFPLLILTLIITGLLFGLMGVVFGVYAKNFEALTFVTSFVLQPMIFLAGTFYPISSLPGFWQNIAAWNPVHHVMNAIRYSVFGISDSSVVVSYGVLVGLLVVMLLLAQVFTKKFLYR